MRGVKREAPGSARCCGKASWGSQPRVGRLPRVLPGRGMEFSRFVRDPAVRVRRGVVSGAVACGLYGRCRVSGGGGGSAEPDRAGLDDAGPAHVWLGYAAAGRLSRFMVRR